MALGGGNFVFENKVMDGAYINFVAGANATPALSDRGIATVPLVLDWGPLGEIFEMTGGDLQRDSLARVGFTFTEDGLCPLREIFRKARKVLVWRMGSGGLRASGTADSIKIGAARYVGTLGNRLRVRVDQRVGSPAAYDVTTLYVAPDGAVSEVATQTVATAADLQDNAFVVFNTAADLSGFTYVGGSVTVTFEGGTNPTASMSDYSAYLAAAESQAFNAICCPSNDPVVKGQFASFTKRMRDEQGVKFQCVVHDYPADHEGIVNVGNTIVNPSGKSDPAYSLVYWVTGIIAGTEVNRNAGNKIYDGEYTVDVNHTQTELEQMIRGGKFGFHLVGQDVRTLQDINSLVNTTMDKNELFKSNQTIRVIDQIGNDIAVLFNTRYLNEIPNDAAGRISFWSDVVAHHEQLQDVRAIENFVPDDVVVEQGNAKNAVRVTDAITVVNAMSKLYMTVIVS